MELPRRSPPRLLGALGRVGGELCDGSSKLRVNGARAWGPAGCALPFQGESRMKLLVSVEAPVKIRQPTSPAGGNTIDLPYYYISKFGFLGQLFLVLTNTYNFFHELSAPGSGPRITGPGSGLTRDPQTWIIPCPSPFGPLK